MFPIKCCIIVPMKVRMAKPATAKDVVDFSTHLVVINPKGEIRIISATKCNHMNGNEKLVPNGTRTKVNGLATKTASKNMFKATTGNHFRLTRKS